MSATRRHFLKISAAAGSAIALGERLPSAFGAPKDEGAAGKAGEPAGAKLKILMLGGTGFLGPALVEYAMSRGHIISLFNRGKRAPNLFPKCENLVGDRDGNLKSLEGRRWDAVIDTSGHIPKTVRESCKILKDSGFYCFVSSMGVYKDFSKPLTEKSELHDTPDPNLDKMNNDTYGPMKILCERAIQETMPDRTLIVRPGLIVGPRDWSDRFTYWPVRVDRGGEVLAPDKPDDPTQFIDSRDLAAFIVRLVERKTTGVFNAAGPEKPLTMGEVLACCKTVSKSDAKFTWADAAFLEENKVNGWTDLPIWVDPKGDGIGLITADLSKAFGAGLVCRPLAETVRDTLAWYKQEPAERREKKMRAGLTPEREKELLAAWHAREKAPATIGGASSK